ncbi:hypothetical protein NM688_g1432 [Phlebia brevispora]|uniref:Uncharacterized protein n=1 Tax=Phlebia brevispora TaxID=194682 RepID=A0ACC1TBS0_9APHY|nr:hypothetical protein NM688_g1432 [Phlebia brevispora]
MTVSNPDKWIEQLMQCQHLSEPEMKALCDQVRGILLEESNIQPVSSPVTICGDIHGQFWDLLELLRKGGNVPETSYIFMAHECQQKYGSAQVWKACCSVFDYLNLAAIIDGETLCVHGGLSPDIRTLDQIRILSRAQEIPHEGAFCDLMWSDPDDVENWAVSPRGAGWLFGGRVTSEFNHNNQLKLIARAHQLVQEGYKYMFDEQLVTVWSAPNYCYRCGNMASILTIHENGSRDFIVYDAAEENERDKGMLKARKMMPVFTSLSLRPLWFRMFALGEFLEYPSRVRAWTCLVRAYLSRDRDFTRSHSHYATGQGLHSPRWLTQRESSPQHQWRKLSFPPRPRNGAPVTTYTPEYQTAGLRRSVLSTSFAEAPTIAPCPPPRKCQSVRPRDANTRRTCTDTVFRLVCTVRLGNSGLKVSKIILGCMSYGAKGWAQWVLDEEEAIKHIKFAYDHGIQTFDTANVYSNGLSEVILGIAIKKLSLPREEIVVMTKLYGAVGPEFEMNIMASGKKPEDFGIIQQKGLNRKHIFDSVKASLKRLQLDYIDVLQCHRFDYDTPIAETMQALHDVVQAGYVRYIGMSSCWAYQFHAMQSYAIQNHLTPFISMQNHYSLLYREEEREMFPTLKTFGVGSVPWSPLARGLLTRPLSEQKATSRGQTDRFVKGYSGGGSPDIINRVEELAKKKGATMAQIALAWNFAKEGVTAPIVGTTSLKNLEELIDAVNIKLTDDEVKYLEEPYQPCKINGHM